jgi:hypothetical protein
MDDLTASSTRSANCGKNRNLLDKNDDGSTSMNLNFEQGISVLHLVLCDDANRLENHLMLRETVVESRQRLSNTVI